MRGLLLLLVLLCCIRPAAAEPVLAAEAVGDRADVQQKLVDACRSSDRDLVLAMLVAGANPDAIDSSGFTALNAACANDDEDIVLYLLEFGADPDFRGHGQAPVFTAAIANWAIVKILVLAGADPMVRNETQHTLLHFAGTDENPDNCAYLLSLGLDLEARNENGSTPLMFAALFDNPATLNYLLDQGADIHAVNTRGLTPLHLALWQGSMQNSGILLAEGAEIDDLFLAAAMNDAQRIHELVEAGANLEQADFSGELAYLWALSRNASEAGRALIDEYSRSEQASKLLGYALGKAVQRNDMELARELLEMGADPNWRDGYGKSLARRAVNEGDMEMTRLLLESGASASSGAEDDELLREAALRGHVGLMRMLIDNGVPVDVKGEGGRTLMHVVCSGSLNGFNSQSEDYRAAALVLRQAGLDLNALDDNGWTPLDCCIGGPPVTGGIDCGTGIDNELIDLMYYLGAEFSQPIRDWRREQSDMDNATK
ncbi:ankyrin repeat domain-containing protein [bacterium]|nr:ankyrin repeat domain-containing protein [bacterium]